MGRCMGQGAQPAGERDHRELIVVNTGKYKVQSNNSQPAVSSTKGLDSFFTRVAPRHNHGQLNPFGLSCIRSPMLMHESSFLIGLICGAPFCSETTCTATSIGIDAALIPLIPWTGRLPFGK